MREFLAALDVRLKQFRCGLAGHLKVTRHEPTGMYEQCFLCDRVLGEGGWQTRWSDAPKRRQ